MSVNHCSKFKVIIFFDNLHSNNTIIEICLLINSPTVTLFLLYGRMSKVDFDTIIGRTMMENLIENNVSVYINIYIKSSII